ncbi:hypothetical protein ACFX15_036766 [Malus domestica]
MAMQRLFSKLRSFSVHSAQTLPSSLSSPSLLRSCPPLLHQPLPFASIDNRWIVRSLFSAHSPTQPSLAVTALRSSPFPFSMVQVRHVSSRERKKRRKPMTPVTSKLKKTKLKSYSSYKSRFRTMNDGTIRRWRAGKRHNAHSKEVKDFLSLLSDLECLACLKWDQFANLAPISLHHLGSLCPFHLNHPNHSHYQTAPDNFELLIRPHLFMVLVEKGKSKHVQ